jgi:hypothetical protein
MRGYCEATIKASYAFLCEGEPEKARRLLLKCKERCDFRASRQNEFTVFYEVAPYGTLGELNIALTRCEMCIGNLKIAAVFSEEASKYAKKAKDFHILGNVYEDQAVLAFNDGQTARALAHNADAVRCFEEFGDVTRAALSKRLLVDRDHTLWLGK